MIVKANSENTLPYFSIDEINGIIDIKGRSISLEADEFFQPIIDYLENYLTYTENDITFNVNLEYFNTKTSRILLIIFRLLKEKTSINDCKLTVNWYYDADNEEIDLQPGEDYSDIVGTPFNYIPN